MQTKPNKGQVSQVFFKCISGNKWKWTAKIYSQIYVMILQNAIIFMQESFKNDYYSTQAKQ